MSSLFGISFGETIALVLSKALGDTIALAPSLSEI